MNIVGVVIRRSDSTIPLHFFKSIIIIKVNVNIVGVVIRSDSTIPFNVFVKSAKQENNFTDLASTKSGIKHGK